MSTSIVRLAIESYPSQRAHWLVAYHPKGHGLADPDGAMVSTTIGQFRSRALAEEAMQAVGWYGDNRFCDGMRAERERADQEVTP
jgi:hypothetical protein